MGSSERLNKNARSKRVEKRFGPRATRKAREVPYLIEPATRSRSYHQVSGASRKVPFHSTFHLTGCHVFRLASLSRRRVKCDPRRGHACRS